MCTSTGNGGDGGEGAGKPASLRDKRREASSSDFIVSRKVACEEAIALQDLVRCYHRSAFSQRWIRLVGWGRGGDLTYEYEIIN